MDIDRTMIVLLGLTTTRRMPARAALGLWLGDYKRCGRREARTGAYSERSTPTVALRSIRPLLYDLLRQAGPDCPHDSRVVRHPCFAGPTNGDSATPTGAAEGGPCDGTAQSQRQPDPRTRG